MAQACRALLNCIEVMDFGIYDFIYSRLTLRVGVLEFARNEFMSLAKRFVHRKTHLECVD